MTMGRVWLRREEKSADGLEPEDVKARCRVAMNSWRMTAGVVQKDIKLQSEGMGVGVDHRG